jgi:hypothetical protein
LPISVLDLRIKASFLFFFGETALSANHELILILDFGSQYTQLIARRVREQGVYCEIAPFHLALSELRRKIRKASSFRRTEFGLRSGRAAGRRLIFTGKSMRRFSAFAYGMQLLAKDLTAESSVQRARIRPRPLESCSGKRGCLTNLPV